jgi:NTE family protein
MRRVPTVQFRHSARVDPPKRPRVAFVLSGGGNQAVVQVGMMRALIERDITPDVVVGTSAGALNGAAVACEPTLGGIAHLERVWEALSGSDIFPGGRLTRAWNMVRKGPYLFDNAGLDALIERATPARDFADLRVPLRVIATDLDTGEEVVLASGPLKPALLATAALPGVYPIVNHDGRRLVDGGVVDTVPLWHALASQVDSIYVMNASSNGHERPLRTPLDVLMASFTHSRNLRFELELRHASPDIEIVVFPRPDDDRDLLDFSGATELMDDAHKLADEVLDAHEAAVDNKPAPERARIFRRFRSA